jgi:hypothetical protein
VTVEHEFELDIPPLYHYCDTNTFKAIVENNQLWLSSLRQSNDAMEGHLLRRLIHEALAEMNLSPDVAAELIDMWDTWFLQVDCFATCLSTEKDLLSQWRGYAANGSGFSIGFDAEALTKLEFTDGPLLGSWANARPQMYYVEYKEQQQKEQVRRVLSEVLPMLNILSEQRSLRNLLQDANDQKKANELGKVKARTEMAHKLIQWVPQAYTIKSEAFAEEHEARLMAVAPLMPKVHRYRTRGAALVPYLRLNISSGVRSPIVSVRLGPTNPTPPDVIRNYLHGHDMEHVEVTTSIASYRG